METSTRSKSVSIFTLEKQKVGTHFVEYKAKDITQLWIDSATISFSKQQKDDPVIKNCI